MTAPAPRPGPDVTERLAEVREQIRQTLDDSVLTHTGRSVGDIASDRVMDDLWSLLVVFAAERVAEELEAAADDPGSAHIAELRDGHPHRVIPARDLYDRAAALRGEGRG